MRITLVSIFLLLLIAFIGCNQPKSKSFSFTDVDKIPSQIFKINIHKDTVLKTSNGAFLDIPNGAISSDDSIVELEIKEAYTMAQMIRANLTTQSNGQPLSSGGMIYINAAKDQAIRIIKTIRVAVPASYLDTKMQLYKGDQTKSRINWIDPVPLTENPMVDKIEEGALLFKNNCGSCHKVEVDAIGPALAHVINRKGKDWAYRYIHRFASIVGIANVISTNDISNDYNETDSAPKTPMDVS